MSHASTAYTIYSLSNHHFQNVQVLTTGNEVLRGQFVQFKVLKGVTEYVYPSEKYCFLPEEKRKLFWRDYTLHDGTFSEFPNYIKLLGLNDIKTITITPLLVV
jgi:hypothetical protein